MHFGTVMKFEIDVPIVDYFSFKLPNVNAKFPNTHYKSPLVHGTGVIFLLPGLPLSTSSEEMYPQCGVVDSVGFVWTFTNAR